MITIQLTVKCGDCFAASLVEDGHIIGECDGYVPDFMPPGSGGDYIILTIDIETGKILNWKKPTESQLHEVFGREDEE